MDKKEIKLKWFFYRIKIKTKNIFATMRNMFTQPSDLYAPSDYKVYKGMYAPANEEQRLRVAEYHKRDRIGIPIDVDNLKSLEEVS